MKDYDDQCKWKSHKYRCGPWILITCSVSLSRAHTSRAEIGIRVFCTSQDSYSLRKVHRKYQEQGHSSTSTQVRPLPDTLLAPDIKWVDLNNILFLQAIYKSCSGEFSHNIWGRGRLNYHLLRERSKGIYHLMYSVSGLGFLTNVASLYYSSTQMIIVKKLALLPVV